MDYEKEFKKATEALEVLDKSYNEEIQKNRALQCEFEQVLRKHGRLEGQNRRLKKENQRLKNAIIEKFIGVELEGEEE